MHVHAYMYRGADKSLARPGRKQANISVRIAWISFGALPCRKKKTWWRLASPCCWNRARPWHASELVSFLVGLALISTPVYIYTHTLSYFMVQSPSWAANWFAASQEIPRISRNPKVHYRTHKRPPPVSILGQPKSVHIPTFHLLEIHPNIIHPSTPRSPQWSLSHRFPHQDPTHPSLLTHTRHMPSPSHSSRFYHPHNIGWGVQII